MLYNYCSLGLDTPNMWTSLLLDCFYIDSMAMPRCSLFVKDDLALFPLLFLPSSGLLAPLYTPCIWFLFNEWLFSFAYQKKFNALGLCIFLISFIGMLFVLFCFVYLFFTFFILLYGHVFSFDHFL